MLQFIQFHKIINFLQWALLVKLFLITTAQERKYKETSDYHLGVGKTNMPLFVAITSVFSYSNKFLQYFKQWIPKIRPVGSGDINKLASISLANIMQLFGQFLAVSQYENSLNTDNPTSNLHQFSRERNLSFYLYRPPSKSKNQQRFILNLVTRSSCYIHICIFSFVKGQMHEKE